VKETPEIEWPRPRLRESRWLTSRSWRSPIPWNQISQWGGPGLWGVAGLAMWNPGDAFRWLRAKSEGGSAAEEAALPPGQRFRPRRTDLFPNRPPASPWRGGPTWSLPPSASGRAPVGRQLPPGMAPPPLGAPQQRFAAPKKQESTAAVDHRSAVEQQVMDAFERRREAARDRMAKSAEARRKQEEARREAEARRREADAERRKAEAQKVVDREIERRRKSEDQKEERREREAARRDPAGADGDRTVQDAPTSSERTELRRGKKADPAEMRKAEAEARKAMQETEREERRAAQAQAAAEQADRQAADAERRAEEAESLRDRVVRRQKQKADAAEKRAAEAQTRADRVAAAEEAAEAKREAESVRQKAVQAREKAKKRQAEAQEARKAEARARRTQRDAEQKESEARRRAERVGAGRQEEIEKAEAEAEAEASEAADGDTRSVASRVPDAPRDRRGPTSTRDAAPPQRSAAKTTPSSDDPRARTAGPGTRPADPPRDRRGPPTSPAGSSERGPTPGRAAAASGRPTAAAPRAGAPDRGRGTPPYSAPAGTWTDPAGWDVPSDDAVAAAFEGRLPDAGEHSAFRAALPWHQKAGVLAHGQVPHAGWRSLSSPQFYVKAPKAETPQPAPAPAAPQVDRQQRPDTPRRQLFQYREPTRPTPRVPRAPVVPGEQAARPEDVTRAPSDDASPVERVPRDVRFTGSSRSSLLRWSGPDAAPASPGITTARPAGRSVHLRVPKDRAVAPESAWSEPPTRSAERGRPSESRARSRGASRPSASPRRPATGSTPPQGTARAPVQRKAKPGTPASRPVTASRRGATPRRPGQTLRRPKTASRPSAASVLTQRTLAGPSDHRGEAPWLRAFRGNLSWTPGSAASASSTASPAGRGPLFRPGQISTTRGVRGTALRPPRDARGDASEPGRPEPTQVGSRRVSTPQGRRAARGFRTPVGWEHVAPTSHRTSLSRPAMSAPEVARRAVNLGWRGEQAGFDASGGARPAVMSPRGTTGRFVSPTRTAASPETVPSGAPTAGRARATRSPIMRKGRGALPPRVNLRGPDRVPQSAGPAGVRRAGEQSVGLTAPAGTPLQARGQAAPTTHLRTPKDPARELEALDRPEPTSRPRANRVIKVGAVPSWSRGEGRSGVAWPQHQKTVADRQRVEAPPTRRSSLKTRKAPDRTTSQDATASRRGTTTSMPKPQRPGSRSSASVRSSQPGRPGTAAFRGNTKSVLLRKADIDEKTNKADPPPSDASRFPGTPPRMPNAETWSAPNRSRKSGTRSNDARTRASDTAFVSPQDDLESSDFAEELDESPASVRNEPRTGVRPNRSRRARRSRNKRTEASRPELVEQQVVEVLKALSSGSHEAKRLLRDVHRQLERMRRHDRLRRY